MDFQFRETPVPGDPMPHIHGGKILRRIKQKNLETNLKTIIPHGTQLFDFCVLVYLLYLSQCACACVMPMRSHLFCCDMVPARHLERNDGENWKGDLRPTRANWVRLESTAAQHEEHHPQHHACEVPRRVMGSRHIWKGREAWISCKRPKQGEEGLGDPVPQEPLRMAPNDAPCAHSIMESAMGMLHPPAGVCAFPSPASHW